MRTEPSGTDHQRTRRPHMGGGFTLIELVAVMVIVAVLAATATPVLSRMGEGRAGMAARQAQRDFSYARQWAVATGQRTWIRLGVAASTWSLYAEDSESGGKAGAAIMTDPGTGRDYRQALNVDPFQGVTIASISFDGGIYLGFDWLGRPLNANETALAANGILTLSGGWQIVVEAGTGHVRLVQP